MNPSVSLLALIGLLFVLAPGLQKAEAGSIKGNVFEDGDTNAERTDEESGSEGQTVKLYAMEDGTWVLKKEVKTDADGNYSFADLPLGNYRIEFSFTSGVVVTTNSIALTAETPDVVQAAIPALPKNYQQVYNTAQSPLPSVLNALNLRNPANLTGSEISRFAP